MHADWFPLWLSLEVATAATAISLAFGLGLAWLLANRDFRGKEISRRNRHIAAGAPANGSWLLPARHHRPIQLDRQSVGSRYRIAACLHMESRSGRIDASRNPAADQVIARWRRIQLMLRVNARRGVWAHPNGGCSGESVCLWRAVQSLPPLFLRSRGRWVISGATLMIAGDIPGRTQTAAVAIFDAVETRQ